MRKHIQKRVRGIKFSLGANWKTSLFGFITIASLFITTNPDLISSVIGESLSKRIFGVASLVSGFVTFYYTKDRNVVGGNTQQTMSGAFAAPKTQGLVDATVIATIASGEKVTPEQEKAATS